MLAKASWFESRRRSKRPTEPTLRIDRPSLLERKLRERRARRGFVTEAAGPIARWTEKRRAGRGFVPNKLSPESRLRLGSVVLAAIVAIGVARNVYQVEPSRPRVATTATTTTTTTTTAPTTTTLPAADSDLCRARDEVLAAAALDFEQGGDAVIANLEAMAPAMEVIRDAVDQPELAAAAETMVPVIADAIVVAQANRTEDLETLALDMGFADSEILDALGTVLSYPLNCAGP